MLLWGLGVTVLFAIYYARFDLLAPDAPGAGILGRGWKALRFSALAFVGSVDPVGAPDVPVGALAIQGTFGLVFIGVLGACPTNPLSG